MSYVCALTYVAEFLNEDPDLLAAIVENDDNLTYGNIVSVQTGRDQAITALTDAGIEEIRDMLASARQSEHEWQEFLSNFVHDPDIAERVKNQRLR